MVIIQLMGEALGELFRNPELLCAHVIKLIRTLSLKGELDLSCYNVGASRQGWKLCNGSICCFPFVIVTLHWLYSISNVGYASEAPDKS